MSMITIRNLDPLVKEKLQERAARHHRSMEAEARDILTREVDKPTRRVDFARAIIDAFADVHDEIPDFDRAQDRPRPAEF